jgi:predicted aspartyl protease
MPIGSFDSNGAPVIDIEILGAFDQPTTVTCVIDTGFSGFLSIPLQAFPIGLVVHGTMPVVFANGTVENKLICLGVARAGGSDQTGLIVLENQSKQILLGMDFLEKFGYKLLLCPTTGQVEMVPEENAFTIAAAEASAPAPIAAPPIPDLNPPQAAASAPAEIPRTTSS